MSRISGLGRRLALVLVLGSVALLASAIPATATAKGTSASTNFQLACFDRECWSGRANFFAKWDRSVVYGEGQYSYWFTKFHGSVGMEVGDDCPVNICTHWAFTVTVQFKNAAGAILMTVFLPNGACYAEAWPGNWVVMTKCKTSFEAPYAATQVKVIWLAQSIGPDNGVTGNWQTSATAAI